MMDFVFVLALAGFFSLAISYVHFVKKLGEKTPGRSDMKTPSSKAR
jgi:hypothetical protein